MVTLANTHDANTHLSGLIDQVLHGEEVIIARNGVPCVRLVPVLVTTQARSGGEFRGRIHGDLITTVNDDSGGWG